MDTQATLPSAWELRPGDCRTIRYLTLVGWASFLLYLGWSPGGWQQWVPADSDSGVPYRVSLDINHCDWPDLCLLPGISETLARRIVATRHRNGGYRDGADLERVAGIGPKTVERLRPLLTLSDRPVSPSEPAADSGQMSLIRSQSPVE